MEASQASDYFTVGAGFHVSGTCSPAGAAGIEAVARQQNVSELPHNQKAFHRDARSASHGDCAAAAGRHRERPAARMPDEN
jgi:hypothetical protein